MWNWLKDNGTSLLALAAILTVILTSTNSIHHRLDAQEKLIEQRFDAQEKLIEQRFETQDRYIQQRLDAQDRYVEQRFDATDERLARIENELAALRSLTVGIIKRVSHNEGQIDVLMEHLQAGDTPAP